MPHGKINKIGRRVQTSSFQQIGGQKYNVLNSGGKTGRAARPNFFQAHLGSAWPVHGALSGRASIRACLMQCRIDVSMLKFSIWVKILFSKTTLFPIINLTNTKLGVNIMLKFYIIKNSFIEKPFLSRCSPSFIGSHELSLMSFSTK